MKGRNLCGARRRGTDDTCKQPAGWGTDHVGSGKCKLHGGKTPRGADSVHFKHGRRSRYKDALPEQLGLKVDEFLDGDPLDLLHELALLRALLSRQLELADSMSTLPGYLDTVRGLADDIRKQVETITKMRNQTALTAAEIAFIIHRIPEIVVKYVAEPDTQTAFINELFSAVPSGHVAETPILTDATVSTDK